MTFQQRVFNWMIECFRTHDATNVRIRSHRFLEEALELVQATDVTESEAIQLVKYVYGRPKGEPAQEIGGVRITTAALCIALRLDEESCEELELSRCWANIEKIRAKHQAKPKFSPLPE